mmetsp:Transcript_15853/g.36538  ORF Transcript_15853/g.36538 Transcript_15853/m.36538 type:complete len:88 (-) Transcript_15853:11-274(-)
MLVGIKLPYEENRRTQCVDIIVVSLSHIMVPWSLHRECCSSMCFLGFEQDLIDQQVDWLSTNDNLFSCISQYPMSILPNPPQVDLSS